MADKVVRIIGKMTREQAQASLARRTEKFKKDLLSLPVSAQIRTIADLADRGMPKNHIISLLRFVASSHEKAP